MLILMLYRLLHETGHIISCKIACAPSKEILGLGTHTVFCEDCMHAILEILCLTHFNFQKFALAEKTTVQCLFNVQLVKIQQFELFSFYLSPLREFA